MHEHPSCGGDCSSCEQGQTAASGPYLGAALALRSLGFFLAPALMALVGALLWNASPLSSLLGASAGLLLGVLICMLFARRARLQEDCDDA